MTQERIPLMDLVKDGKVDFIDTDKIDDLLELFNVHNLMPELSKHEHVFANVLAMLAVSLKWSGNAVNLFESLPNVRGREIDLLDVINTMNHLGFSSSKLVMNINDIDTRLFPCLFIPEAPNASPLILLDKQNGKFRAFHGKRKKLVEFVANDFSGDVYFFQRNDSEEMDEGDKIKKAIGMSWFDQTLYRFKPIIKQIIIISVVINILALAMPLFTMSIYNTVIGSGSISTLWQIVVGVMIAIFSETALRMVRIRLIVWLGVRLDNIVSTMIFEKLLLIKASFTEGASISAQISRIKTFESVRKFFTGPLFTVIIELPFTLILLFAIWLIGGPIVYIPIIVAILFVLMLIYFRFQIRLAMRESAKAASARQQLGMESFIKMNSLHHNGVVKNWWLRYKEKLGEASIANFRSGMISSVIEALAHSISLLSAVAVILVGIELIWNNSLSMGALIAVIMLIWRILSPLQALSSMLPRLEQLIASVEQINRLSTIEVERRPTVLRRPIENLNGHIVLTNVGLRYSMEVEPIFVGLDVEAKPGEIVAITGANGSGKSSILKLIDGLYQPQTGTIKIDGMNIKQFDPIELRKYIRYLPQVPNFFEGTIRENLMLANPIVSEKDLLVALEKATGLNDLKTMEKGLDTLIYGNNAPIPNNYKYVLNLTRVFLKKGNILLLDELPNSSLNEEAGLAYRRLIEEAKGERTVFFVSQRDDFIKLADKVIVLKPGTRPMVLKPDQFINQYGS